MARVYVCDENFVAVSFNKLMIYKLNTDKVLRCHVPSIRDPATDDANQPNVCKKEGSDQILAAVFSPSGKYFAASDDHKQLTVWNVDSGWVQVNTRTIPRRATALVFTKSDDQILVADKAGDVYRFSTLDNGSSADFQGVLVVGHVSMLLDVRLCSSDRYLVTCDRDEKIRVSHYPNAYNIQSFCLGHSDFVNRLVCLEDDNLLISGSGDGTVKLWDYINGILLADVNCKEFLNKATNLSPADSCSSPAVRCITSKGRHFAVSLQGQPVVLLFVITDKDGTTGISFGHRLSLAAPVLDLVFFNSCHLLVLQSLQGASAVAFKFNETLSDVTPLTNNLEEDSGMLKTIQKLNEDTDLFESSQATSTLLPVLRKAHIDNMADYIEKKKQFIKNKKQSEDDASLRKSDDERLAKKLRLTS